jgi:hypothetical protein
LLEAEVQASADFVRILEEDTTDQPKVPHSLQLTIPDVSDVEKVPQLMLVEVQGPGYKQARVADAAVHERD